LTLAIFGKTESGAAPAGVPAQAVRPPQATVIGPGARLVGDLTGEEDALVLGRIEGKILVGGKVEIGAGGEVEGNIEAREVVVAGQVRGEIRAAERAELASTAVVNGAVQSPKIVIAEGAQLTGSVAMGGKSER
jgi:cytoskeletal protein CcmA (bactofilin family)